MPVNTNPIPIELAREYFDCDFEAGTITNRFSSTSRKAGERADGAHVSGYRLVSMRGVRYLAHRVVWAIAHGEDPDGYIDHINGDRSDNRLSNLRVVTHNENMYNSKPKPSRSGVKGVHLRTDNGMYRAYITVDQKRLNLGQFSDFEAAKKAVQNARKELHGPYARS